MTFVSFLLKRVTFEFCQFFNFFFYKINNLVWHLISMEICNRDILHTGKIIILNYEQKLLIWKLPNLRHFGILE